jgi:o-succinylbenzoate synthase
VKLSLTSDELHLRTPILTAHGEIKKRDILVVTATQDNVSGSGEIAPLPGFGLENLKEASDSLQAWVRNGPFPLFPGAAGAASCAITQLKAALEGVSLDIFLSSRILSNRNLSVQSLIGAESIGEVENMAQIAIANGHKAIKLKVGALSETSDIARIIAARNVTPDQIHLRLDANQGWNFSSAERVLKAVSDLNIDYVEEPTTNLSDYKQLRSVSGANLAADEHLSEINTAVDVLRSGLIQVAVIKPTVLGGPQAAYDLSKIAQEHNIRCVVSSFIDGPVGLRAARDLALAIAPAETHGVGTGDLFSDSMPSDVLPHRGFLRSSN